MSFVVDYYFPVLPVPVLACPFREMPEPGMNENRSGRGWFEIDDLHSIVFSGRHGFRNIT